MSMSDRKLDAWEMVLCFTLQMGQDQTRQLPWRRKVFVRVNFSVFTPQVAKIELQVKMLTLMYFTF